MQRNFYFIDANFYDAISRKCWDFSPGEGGGGLFDDGGGGRYALEYMYGHTKLHKTRYLHFTFYV